MKSLEKIKNLYNKTNTRKDLVPNKYKLLYYCGKIETILQELIDEGEDIKDTTLEYKYSELLEYCLKALKIDNVDLEYINDASSKYVLTNTNIYSLMEYSIRKFDAPLQFIYDFEFKTIIKSIIIEIVESKLFYNILKHPRWI